VRKSYEAIAPLRAGLPMPLQRESRIASGEPFFRQREVEGAPNSLTRMDRIESCGALARYALEPVTGKKHQLRVHMHALGMPIVNDRIYPAVSPAPPDDFARPLQLLARRIAFTDPFTGQARSFESRQALLPWDALGC
jgi:tRNA pseudouridine32 synthase / 23S rRNA pseudouridine746 synthase